ncbi:MAG: cytochrome c biogenesis protein CcsA [Nitrospirota bacterium]
MNSPAAINTLLNWIAVFFYIIATIMNAYGIIFRKELFERRSFLAIFAGLVVHTAAILYWWRIAGHGPYLSSSEVLVSDAWVMMVLYLIFRRFYPRIRFVSIIIFPCVFLMIALGIFYNPEIITLTPIFTSIWLIFHISFYKIALAAIVIVFGLSLLVIFKKKSASGWISNLPPIETLDAYAHRFAGFAFMFWAIGMLAGSIWAHQSWGRFWGWDPIETWSLITWVMLGLYLHLRRFYNWKEERAAYLMIFCFAVSIFSVFLLPAFDISVHNVYFR